MLFGLAGLPAAGELHGDMTQAARLESLDRFRKVCGGAVVCVRVHMCARARARVLGEQERGLGGTRRVCGVHVFAGADVEG